MKNARVLADGLRFPEGPVAMDDGSVIVTELIGQRLTRVAPDGTTTTVAETGGSPNGLAVGPDGALYGNVCVATIINGGISIISPDGDVEHVPPPAELFDPVVTNICWGGPDMTTAYITLSATQRLIACDWPIPGKRLAFNA